MRTLAAAEPLGPRRQPARRPGPRARSWATAAAGCTAPDGTLGSARWRSRAWICCVTAFRGRHRAVLGEGYTEIFFLDEATALAAGHRPCFECRRADALAFAAAWGRARRAAPPRAPDDGSHPACRAPRPARARRLRRRCHADAIFRAEGCFYLRTPRARCAGISPATAPPSDFEPGSKVTAVTPATRARRCGRLSSAVSREREAQRSAR